MLINAALELMPTVSVACAFVTIIKCELIGSMNSYGNKSWRYLPSPID